MAGPARGRGGPSEAGCAGPKKLPIGHPRGSTLNIGTYVAEASNVAPVVLEHGFAIVHRALCTEACDEMLRCCEAITEEMLAIDTKRHGNRGSGRYSMGAAAASGQQLHHLEWARLLSDPVLDALDSIFGVGGYVLRGGGGEVVLGNVDEYQDLHADISRQPASCDTQERPPNVVVNFAVHDISEEHGPTRIWPAHGRPRHQQRPMRQSDEPQHILRSTLAPLPMGSCIVRDARIWHGGTPNFLEHARYLPNLEFFSREYAEYIGSGAQGGGRFCRKTMSREVFDFLSERAKRVVGGLVADGHIPTGIQPNFVRMQGRAFREHIMQQLAKLPIAGEFRHIGNGHECHQIRELGEAQGYRCELVRNGPLFSVSVTRVV